MFHYFGTTQNTKGDALPGWYAEAIDIVTSAVVPIYADEGGTPIETVSGEANRAKSDDQGNYDFFIEDGNYSLRIYDSAGLYQRTLRYLPMYGNLSGALADGLAQINDAKTSAAVSESNAAASASSASINAISATNAATTATTQAGAVAAAMNSSNAPYANAYASTLPKGVTSTSITAAGTGGTSGTYALGVSGGPTGFAGTYTISGGGVTAITITNPGLSTTTTAPTLSFPSGSVTGATATATVSTLVADQKTYWVASADSSQILLYGNNGGTFATAPFGATQLVMASKATIDARLNFFSVPGGEYALTLGKPTGPIYAGVTNAYGHFDFTGVRTLPIGATDGTITATLTGVNSRSGFLLRCFDSVSGALYFGLQNDGTLVANIAVTEVINARGTATDLNTRISRGLTAAGSPKSATQNLGRLRGLRSGLTYLKNGGTGLIHIILDGDSWWDSKNYGSTDAITRFYADSGLTNAGPGWIGLASAIGGGTSYHGTALNNISISRSGTWTDLFRSADGSPGTPQNFPGYDAAQSGADGSIYTITGSTIANCTSLTLYCGKGGTVEQSWDGTNYTSVTVTAGSGSTTATINMTGKSSSLRLRCTNGTVIAGLFGLTASSGVVFSNLSNSGSTATQKASVQSNADYKAMMAALSGDVTVPLIQLGLNDTKAGTAGATIVTNIGTVAAGYRAIFSGYESADILVSCQPNTPLSVQDTLSPLLRAWAEDNDAAFLDWQTYFGLPATSGDYASYSRDYTSGSASTALPLLEVSTTYRHPSPTSALIAAGRTASLSGAMVVASTLSNVLLSPLRSL